MTGWMKNGVAVAGLAFIAVVAAAAGKAGEAGQNNQGKSLADMNLEEMRSYQGFFYLNGGRDPLTMRYPTAREQGIEEMSVRGKRAGVTLTEMEQALDAAIRDIESSLSQREYEKALKTAEDMVHTIDYEWPPLKADPPELRRKDDQIRGYVRLAARLKAQDEIAREFAALNLSVDGVAWSPVGARAIINSRVVDAGEILSGVREQGDLRIESIEEHAVVFQFKGIRFRRQVEVYSGR